jgi:nucleotide-binding universal stress UspA family protein
VRTIVVGYDATAPSQRALERAAQLAEAFRSKLVVVSVGPLVPPGTPLVGGDPFLAPLPPLSDEADVLPEGREAAEKDLERARSALGGRSLEVEYVAATGDPADEIVAAAEHADADLIVVGTREPGFVDRLLSGSVSQSVARSAHSDVLIVHPHD